jgi:RNA polymerase sigma factor (sigma-70 family)
MSRREEHADRAVVILEATSRELLRYLERRVGTDDAPDALSETMTIIWRRSSSIPSTDEEARLWVFGVARNVVLNFSRGRRRQSLLAERLRGTIGRVGVLDPPSDITFDVRVALDRLAPDLGELVRLVHWDGFSISEAAQIIGVPASTARSRYQRAKRDLGELLASQPEERTLGIR